LVFATIRAIRLFRLAKESRESGGGFLKGGTVGDSLKWRSFGTFLSPRKEKYKEKLTDKLKFTNPSLLFQTLFLANSA
jgi:hypothetical protein